jgi:dephospho-CoA kinase
MLRVGITGGIGSGKTTVAGIFEVLGIPVYYADDAAKRLMGGDEALKAEIVRHFGEASYTGGKPNRGWLAGQVFRDPKKLALLNSLVHPLTIADAERWMRQQQSAYAVKEAALIFESGADKYLDYVVGVYAPLSLRLDRAVKRSRGTREEILDRMKNQLDEDYKMSRCHTVIKNDEQNALIPQVLALHQTLLELSAENHSTPNI